MMDMARVLRPTSSSFGRVVRSRREELRLSKADLARALHFSISFLDVLETGRRGCDLDDLPRIAAALDLDPQGLAKVYLAERHAKLYKALYGEAMPVFPSEMPGMRVEDV